MVLVEVFCFWFSVRLGSIIIGILTLIQCCILISAYLVWEENKEVYTSELHSFLEDFVLSEGIVKNIAYDLETYLTPLVAFLSTLLVFSVLLIIASFLCKPFLIIPFLITYPAYIILILVTHVSVMVSLKKQDIGIGNLILYSNLGGFVILLLLYMWVCVLCFVQIIYELRSELQEKKNKVEFQHGQVEANKYYGKYQP